MRWPVRVKAIGEHAKGGDDLALADRDPTGDHAADQGNQDEGDPRLGRKPDSPAFSIQGDEREQARQERNGAKQPFDQHRLGVDQKCGNHRPDHERRHGPVQKLQGNFAALESTGCAAGHADGLGDECEFQGAHGIHAVGEHQHGDKNEAAPDRRHVADE